MVVGAAWVKLESVNQPIKEYPLRVGVGITNRLPKLLVCEEIEFPPLVLKVMVYWLIVHFAYRVRLYGGINRKSNGIVRVSSKYQSTKLCSVFVVL